MAGGGIVSASGNAREYPGKLTFYVFITCLVAAMGGLIFGYDIGISGGVTSMDTFLERFFPDVYRKQTAIGSSSTNQYCKFNSETLTMFTSSLYLAALVSSMVASYITRKLGRRISMLAGGIIFLAGALLNGFAQALWMLIVGRVLLGFGIGFANQAVPLYLSEMAPSKYRGALNSGFQLFITVGILIANVVNYLFSKIHLGWRLSLGGAMVPALIITIGSILLPDTPNSMIERGEHEKAKSRLKKIRGVESVDEEFNDLVAASHASNQVKHPWKDLLQRKYRPHLVMAILIPFFQQFTGINVIMFYAPVLFKTIGFGSNASLASAVITGLVNVVATFVSIGLVDRFGRRAFFLQGGIQMFICQSIITICIGVKFGTSGNPGDLPKWFASVVVTFICLYVAGFAWSWGPLGWLVPSEIFPLEIRSAAQSINVAVNMIFTFVVAQVFLNMLCHMKFGLFIFFACFVVAMTAFVYFLLPETKNIPIEDMSVVWKQHWYWKRYTAEDDNPLKNKGEMEIA